MRLPRPLVLTAVAALAVLASSSCDKASPVAPTGTLLTVTATPNEIALTGVSTITVLARRENGLPINPGTEVRLSATLGRLDDAVLLTDDSGIVSTSLRGDGRIGQAEIIARAGAVESTAVMVTIGRLASSVSLQATPLNVRDDEGGAVSLLALIRDEQGQPLPGISVNFVTAAGVLESQGAFQNTDASGQVSDTLTVTVADLSSISADEFTVSVEASGAGGTLQTAMQTIGIQRAPRASFTFTVNGLTVSFQDTSTGRPTSWQWKFGDGPAGQVDSQQQNPTHVYSAAGRFTVELDVSNGVFEDCDSCNSSLSVEVTVQP